MYKIGRQCATADSLCLFVPFARRCTSALLVVLVISGTSLGKVLGSVGRCFCREVSGCCWSFWLILEVVVAWEVSDSVGKFRSLCEVVVAWA